MNLLVLEGPDGTGKTTLARALEKRGYQYVHNGPPPEGVGLFEHYTRQLLKSFDQKVVFDRLHLGELIYGPVMRGKSLITVEQFRLLNRLLFSIGGKIVFCDTDNPSIERNWMACRGEEYLTDLYKLYNVIFKYRELVQQELDTKDVWVYSYQASSGKFLMKEIEELGVPSKIQGDWCPPGVLGRPDNKFLFIGERVNPELSFGQDLAFYSMENSAGFFNRCLWEAGYQEHELAFTNALDLDHQSRDLYDLWTRRREQVVVTLGKVAHEACVNQAVPHLAAPHPQFIKRFELKKRGEYVELLNRFRGGL
jgi:hypothetical protein